MRIGKKQLTACLLTISMAVLILDSKTALEGAQEGVQLCVSVVIPCLFPFLFLSVMLPACLIGRNIPGVRRLGRLCGIPDGAESLLLLGFLGGYPTGASMIADAYKQGTLSKEDARRMLGFCNNAGPAFLFGMVGNLFSVYAVWILWLIHIISALFVGMILPKKQSTQCTLKKATPISVTQALNKSLKVMGSICGYVVIFRVVITILNRWVLWLLPQSGQVAICGLLELSNGIISLHQIDHSGLRFLLCAVMLAFGSLCVSMQTLSVTDSLGFGKYFPGKILQCIFSLLLASLAQFVIFPAGERLDTGTLIVPLIVSIGIYATYRLTRRKKVVAFCS